MADFCKQCADEHGFESGDLDGIVGSGSEHPMALWLHAICEGCGDAVVNHEGVCHSDHCLKKHGDRPPFVETR